MHPAHLQRLQYVDDVIQAPALAAHSLGSHIQQHIRHGRSIFRLAMLHAKPLTQQAEL